MAKHPRTWLVRAGKNATFIDDFRANSHVAIGWRETGPIPPSVSDDALTDLFDRTFPSAKPGTRRVWQAQVRRFLTEIRPGDRVATYDPNTRVYLLGTVAGDVEWRDGPLPRVRTVQWTHQVLRDALSVDTRNGLGSIATFFRASQDTSDELWAKAVPLEAAAAEAPPPAAVKVVQDDAGEASETILREEVREKAEQFIEDRMPLWTGSKCRNWLLGS
jgi:restriction system protein